MSILSSQATPYGDEISGHSTLHTLLLSSHIGLVPILHLGVVRLLLTEAFHPSLAFVRTANQTQVKSVAALHANCYTTGSSTVEILSIQLFSNFS